MNDRLHYVRVSWAPTLETVKGVPFLPRQVVATQLVFWRTDQAGEHSILERMDAPPHMTSIDINLVAGEWYFSARIVLVGDVFGKWSAPKRLYVGVHLPPEVPKAPVVSLLELHS